MEQGKVLNEELRRDVSEKVKNAVSNIQGNEPVDKIADRISRMTPEERAILKASLEKAETEPAVEAQPVEEESQPSAT